MTSMTIIDELLVLLDDETGRTLEEVSQALPGRSKQTLSSTLGRLIAKGWIERGTGRTRHQYRITKTGQRHVTNQLDQIALRNERTWDGSWEQVIFNIPEHDRKRRDDLRLLLIDLGYGRLHNSVWLSPWSGASAVEAYVATTNSQTDVTILRTGTVALALSKRIAEKFEWDWELLDASYAEFITEANQFLRSKTKRSFDARRIVYHYAKILMTDPKLPSELPQRSKQATEAYARYEAIRPFCYQE